MFRGLWIGCLVASLLPGVTIAQEKSWRENFDAGRQALDEGRYVEADKHMTLALKQAAAGRDLFATVNQLSLIRHALGRFDEAIDLGKRALSGAESVGDAIDVGYCLNNLGLFLWAKGRTEEAEPYLKKALETLERAAVDEESKAGLAKTTNNVGNLYYNKGRWKEAGEYWHRSLAIHERIQMREPLACNTLANLGTWHWARGEREKSWEFFRRSLKHIEQRLNKDHPLYGGTLNYTGYNYLEEGKLDEAEAVLKQAMAIFEKRKLSATHPMVADCLRNWGELHRLRKQYERGEKYFRESLAGWQKSVQKVPREAKTHFKLGLLYFDQEKWPPAEASFEKALEIYDQAVGGPHPEIADVLEQYAIVLQKTGREAQAVQMQARAKAMRVEHARVNRLE